MPITQSRMIALIAAADELKDGVLAARRFIGDTLKALPANPTREEALGALQGFQQYLDQFIIPAATFDLLANEKAHFRANAARNARHARRAAAKRSGAPKAHTAPTAIGTAPSAGQRPALPASHTLLSPLALAKLSINETCAACNMPPEFSPAELHDDAPLAPHKRAMLGLEAEPTPDVGAESD